MIGLPNPWVLLGITVAAFGAGVGVTASIKNGQLARLELRQTNERIAQRDAAIADMAAASAAIKTAAENYQTDKTDLGAKIDAVRKEMRNAKPLPAGCVLDVERLRNIDAAINAVNETLARQRVGPTVSNAKNTK